MGYAAFGKTRQVLPGKAIMQGGHGLVGGGQGGLHVGTLEHQRIMGCAKQQRRMKGYLVGRDINRLWPLDQHPPGLDHSPTEPAAQRQCASQ
ncbi:hypothetical protein D3C78_1519350 [compost metagenome]